MAFNFPGSPTNGQTYTSGGITYVYSESLGVWAVQGSNDPFTVGGFVAGLTSADEKVFQFVFTEAVTFPANFAGAYGRAEVASTGNVVYGVYKNGATAGTITFATGATGATFGTTGGAALACSAGDYLQVKGPASPDATLADWSFTLKGTW